MDGEAKSIVLSSEKNVDADPISVMQTGYDFFDVMMTNLWGQASAGLTGFTLPKSRAFYDDQTKLEAGTDCYTIGQSGNPYLFDVVTDLVAQSRTYIRTIIGGSWPNMSASTALMNYLYYDMIFGLFNQPPVDFKDDFTTASTLEELIQGFSWKDSGVGSLERHETWIRRFIYAMGLYWHNKFPSFTDRLQAADAATYIERCAWIFLCMAIEVLWHIFPLLWMQSDRAVLNLALLRENFVPKKIDPGLGQSVDPMWKLFVQESKKDILGSNFSDHKCYTSDWISVGSIEGTNLENSIYEYQTTFIVPAISLKIARQMVGVGKYDKDGETNHFLFVVNGAKPSSSGTYDTHGESTYELGWNSALGLHYLKGNREWWQEVLLFLPKQTHWTFKEMKKIFDDSFVVNFSLEGSLKGLIEQDTYKALRSVFIHNDTNYASNLATTEVAPDPQACRNTTALGTTIAYSKPYAFWVIPFVGQRAVSGMLERYRLVFSKTWNVNELRFLMLYGMFFGVTSSTNWQNLRWNNTRIRLTTVIETKDNNRILCLAYSYKSGNNAEQVRFEALKSPLDYTNYPAVALKYMCWLNDKNQAYVQVYSPARPKGLKDSYTTIINDIGHPNTLRSFINLVFGSDDAPKASASTDVKAPVVAEKVSVPQTSVPAKSSPSEDEDHGTG